MSALLSYEGHETQMAVVTAFEKLLSERKFGDITVNMICKEASISRATFYYHFKDKYDISQWHYGYVAERFLFQTGRTFTWLQANYLNETRGPIPLVLRHGGEPFAVRARQAQAHRDTARNGCRLQAREARP